MPSLLMLAQSDAVERLVGGTLSWDGTTHVQTVSQALGAVFGDFMDYAFAQASGELADVDEDLCRRHGLTYQSIESTSSVGSSALSDAVRLSVAPDDGLARQALTAEDLENDGAAFVAAHGMYLNDLQAKFKKYVWRSD